MLKGGLIGFGGIARAHRKGYLNLEKLGKASLVAACDINPDAFQRKIKINIDEGSVKAAEHIHFYTDVDEMLRGESLDFIDICVPSFLHSKITVDMLRRGYPVLCEKPMALTSRDCDEMIRASEESGKALMIGQCLRFHPAYNFVKDAIDGNRFGKLVSAFFSRISAPPVWGWENWFMTPERSGGCITDLHIHDVDMIRYLFGEPETVSCHASTSVCLHDTVHTAFGYGSVPVTAIGDWALSGIPFSASYRISFEQATVVYEQDTVTVYPKDGSAAYPVSLDHVSAYEGEISYFCDVVTGAVKNTRNPATSAATTIRLIEHMRQSADAAGERIAFSV